MAFCLASRLFSSRSTVSARSAPTSCSASLVINHVSAVDIHVHRVTNRWGYVNTPTPEKTTAMLEGILPHSYWIEINRLLVPFGKHICTGRLPRCSTCPVLDMCRQIGVTTHR